MPKRKAKKRTGPVFRPCGKCMSGLVKITRPDGSTAMRQCECLRVFKGLQMPSVVDGKARAANG